MTGGTQHLSTQSHVDSEPREEGRCLPCTGAALGLHWGWYWGCTGARSRETRAVGGTLCGTKREERLLVPMKRCDWFV